ncbi:MAG: ABC transporter permease [Gemmatimonadales bacterium]|jgi:putative ABC transport system permease protein
MSSLWADIRYSVRVIGKNPGFAAVAILTLALGIGANTAIFSVVDSILLRPLPFPDSERLVVLCEENPAVAGFCVASPPNVEDWSRQARAIEALGIGRDWAFILKTETGSEGLSGGLATPSFFKVLGLNAQVGRLFLPEDQQLGSNNVVVLGHGLWQTQFGGDPGVVGRVISLDDHSYTVVGVLPAGVEIPRLEYVEIWTPLHIDPTAEEHREWRGFKAYGRLAEDAALDEARDEMNVIAGRLAEAYPATNEGWTIAVSPLREHVVGSIRATLLIFLGAMGFVLLIGCANVANLLLARATERRREFAVRAAIGAGRSRLVRLLLTESLLLALVAGALGLVLSFWAVEAFIALAPGGIPRLEEVGIDRSVLIFATLLSMSTCVVFGLAPALFASRLDLNQSLKEGDQRSPGRSGSRLRSALVVSEVALALVLLIGAGLLTRSFAELLRWEPGFDQSNLMETWLLASDGKYSDAGQVAELFDAAVEEVASLPSVVSVGMTSAGPLFGGREPDEFAIAGRSGPEPDQRPVARRYDIGPGYFRTLGIPLQRGRDFTAADTRAAPPVAIINETLARRYFPNEDPIGQQVTMLERPMTIVGVVSDVQPFRAGDPIEPEIYWPFKQRPRYATFLLIRTASDPTAAIRPIEQRLKTLDPDMNVSTFRTMEELVGRQLVRPRFNMLLIGVFASVALLLAAIGIFGVISYSVAQRTREIGVRVALGAADGDIFRSVVGRGMTLTLTGVALGLVGAFGVTRVLSSLLVGVRPTDPLTFASIAVLLMLVALLACYVPARRAMRVDAMVALRSE